MLAILTGRPALAGTAADDAVRFTGNVTDLAPGSQACFGTEAMLPASSRAVRVQLYLVASHEGGTLRGRLHMLDRTSSRRFDEVFSCRRNQIGLTCGGREDGMPAFVVTATAGLSTIHRVPSGPGPLPVGFFSAHPLSALPVALCNPLE